MRCVNYNPVKMYPAESFFRGYVILNVVKDLKRP